MSTQQHSFDRPRGGVLGRELRTLLMSGILGLGAYLALQTWAPEIASVDVYPLVRRFVGPAWPFFLAVALFLLYVAAAWLAEGLGLGPDRRNWGAVCHVLHWATEASPLVGLLTTFFSLLQALLAYGRSGPATAETQAAFIEQFAVAFGSSIAGGILGLFAFTLYKALDRD